jgi:hypothetical protein
LSTVNFTAPCTLTFQVTGPSVPSTSGGPAWYAIVADQSIQGSTTSHCFGVINIAPFINPIFTYGTIPNNNPINCNGNQTETDSSISAYWATGGVSFAVQCVIYMTWLGASCDYVTGAMQININ